MMTLSNGSFSNELAFVYSTIEEQLDSEYTVNDEVSYTTTSNNFNQRVHNTIAATFASATTASYFSLIDIDNIVDIFAKWSPCNLQLCYSYSC